jgi:hypothetical protein
MAYPFNAVHPFNRGALANRANQQVASAGPLQAQPPVAPRPTLGGSAGRSALADAMLQQAQSARAPRTVLEGIGTQLAPSLIGAMLKKDVADERSKFIAGLAGLKGPEVIKALIASGDAGLGTAGLNAKMAAMAAANKQETFTPVLDADGQIVAQRSLLTGKVEPDPRTKKPVTEPKQIPVMNAKGDHVFVTNKQIRENPGDYTPIPKAPLIQYGVEATEAEKVVGKFWGESFVGMQKAGLVARRQNASLDRLGSLLDQVTTGTFAGNWQKVKKAFKGVGFDLEHLGFKDDVAFSDAATALSNEMALQLRNPAGGAGMPGALSDKDREFLVSMVPGLGQDKEGRELLIETRKRLNKRSMDVARLARKYRQKHGELDGEFYDTLEEFGNKNTLFDELRTAPTARTLPPPAPGYTVIK